MPPKVRQKDIWTPQPMREMLCFPKEWSMTILRNKDGNIEQIKHGKLVEQEAYGSVEVGVHPDQKDEDRVSCEGNNVDQKDEVDQEAGILELREESQEDEICSGCIIYVYHISPSLVTTDV